MAATAIVAVRVDEERTARRRLVISMHVAAEVLHP